MLHEKICNDDFQSNAELHLYKFNDIMKMKNWSSQWTQFMYLRKEAWKK